jgi:hypothetical protein
VGEIKTLIIEDRFGFISSSVPKLFKPKLIIKNYAREAGNFLKRCKNPRNLPLPPDEPRVPEIEGYTLNVFFRLYYTDIEDFSKEFQIEELKILESPLVEFEMKFLAGKVPFADYSRVYVYELKELKEE